MSKTKKMTFNMLAVNLQDEEPRTVKVLHDTVELEVKRILDWKQARQFVYDIVGSCVDIASGAFNAEVFDFAVRINTLMAYAGIDAPKNLDKAYAVVYQTDVFDRVFNVVGQVEQYSVLVDAAREQIEYMKDIIVAERASIAHDLLTKIDMMIGDSAAAMDEINSEEFKEKLNNMLQVISSQVEQPESEQSPNQEVAVANEEVVEKTEEHNRDNIILLKRDE